jgi:uncharacterized protein YuzE
MPITASYDPDADALYIRLSDGDRARTVELDDVVYLDVDTDGHAVGLELLYPSLGLDAHKIANATGFHSQMTEILAAIAAVGAPIQIPTTTGGAHFASAVIHTRAVEGATPAGVPPANVTEAGPSSEHYASVG